MSSGASFNRGGGGISILEAGGVGDGGVGDLSRGAATARTSSRTDALGADGWGMTARGRPSREGSMLRGLAFAGEVGIADPPAPAPDASTEADEGGRIGDSDRT